MFSIRIISIVLLSFVLDPSTIRAQSFRLAHLKTEYVENPLGIDTRSPRFSWQMETKKRNASQSAYQVTVIDEFGKQVWNSGKIKTNISLNIQYKGLALKPRTHYKWALLVWDEHQNIQRADSWFETGLMNGDTELAAWNGAKWIGGNDSDLVLYSHYLPVFKLQFSIQLDESSKTTSAGFIYGANDDRLMDENKNLYQLKSAKGGSYILLELDISSLKGNDSARLNIYRVGYAPTDKKDVPFKSCNIPTSLVNDQNKSATHTIYVSTVLGDTYIHIDGLEKQNQVIRINLNPLGRGGDFIAYPVVGDLGFFVKKGHTAFFSNVTVSNYRSPSNTLFEEELHEGKTYDGIFSAFTNELTISGNTYKIADKSGDVMITADPSRNSMPLLRTTFSTVSSKIKKARLYVTSRGIYDMYINGKRVGEDYFNPGLTQYNKTHLYQVFDVTKDIVKGENALGAMLGEGWWSGGATYLGDFWNFFGDRQSLLAQLIITYEDGKEQKIVTSPDSWKYYNNGPLVYGSLFQGEVYDATKDSVLDGWSTPLFKDGLWKKSTLASLNGHISIDQSDTLLNMSLVNDYTNMELIAQYDQSIRKVKELSAVAVDEVRPGVFIYDMGQNFAGVPRIELTGLKKGDKVILRFAEVKYPAISEYGDKAGTLMLENIRAAMAQEIYLAKGGNEVISPRFTYHGYRYVEITGLRQALPLTSVKGIVLSSIHKLVSSYETSSKDVNKLWSNITSSTFSNCMSIPTDCPQRNERLGWSGDISVFARTATYLADLPQFLRRHMRAMRDVQRCDGRFTDVAPLGGGFGGVLWGSAGITVAWESYQQYGDKALLEEHYKAMKEYIQFLIRHIDVNTGVLHDNDRMQWSSLGDWLSPEYDKTEKTLLWEAYFIYDLERMSKIADVLNKKEDAKWLLDLSVKRKAFFNRTYVNKSNGKTQFRGKTIDTQSSYAVPMQFGIFDDQYKELVKANFAETVTRSNKADDGTVTPPYSLMTGFIGTAWINSALSDNGYDSIAYSLLTQTSYPSWLYSVKQGATTIWERLNSYTSTNGFGGNNRMNSFNHYSFGAIGAWMYAYSLGIQRDENRPGFKHFILQPIPDPTKQLTFARGYYESLYGRIESSWMINGDSCVYHFVIPGNATATLLLNASSVQNINEGNHLFKASEGVKYLGVKKGKYAFELSSGDYTIHVK